MKMKFLNLKLKKDQTPNLSSLRPPIWNANLSWFLSLGLFCIIFIATTVIGLQLFYSQYFESYKNLESGENTEALLNLDRLKAAIQKRSNFINTPRSIPTDPSL